MNDLTFKEKFPELNDNQRRQLKRELLEIIGEYHKITGLEPTEIEDFYATTNKVKSEIRQRLDNYMGDE